MSKRFIFKQQSGDRKKAKLDVTHSDHNFPLSQNAVSNSDANHGGTWGDDNDDEILLLASQVCEQAYNDQNLSVLPDYTICMKPSSTSTQMLEPIPSTSKSTFSFKKPVSPSVTSIKTNICDRISSPLPGISSKAKTDGVNISDDLILNDKICHDQDANFVYRQLLHLQEENAKLKSENGKLLEKCVTKEGEASILRSQLKNCQSAVDNARIEKVNAQEKAQMEWSEKLAALNNQMHDLRTQLDFKNLEIISVKEKCKMLESAKIKLTQVTVAGNDTSVSQRLNSSHLPQENVGRYKRTKTVSNAIQTEGKSHFLKLNTVIRSETSNLKEILPHIMEPTVEQYSVLDFNDKLKTDLTRNCRVFSIGHRLPSTPSRQTTRASKILLSGVYEDIANIVASQQYKYDNYIKLFNTVNEVLREVQLELEGLSQRMTSAFLKEMDDRYIEATNELRVVRKIDLLSGSIVIKDEQAILARRILIVLVYVLEDSKRCDVFEQVTEDSKQNIHEVVSRISNICLLLDKTSSTLYYSGVLLSVTHLLKLLISYEETVAIVKNMVTARPALPVSCALLHLLRYMDTVTFLCPGGGNLKTDYDHGVLLYKKDSCTLQVLLKQIEVAVKCAERQGLPEATVQVASDLLRLYNDVSREEGDAPECECQLVLLQVLVHALQVTSTYLSMDIPVEESLRESALRVCKGGASALCGRAAAARLGRLRFHRGLLQRLADVEPLGSILSETLSVLQAVPEEPLASYHSQAWLRSFQTFSLAD